MKKSKDYIVTVITEIPVNADNQREAIKKVKKLRGKNKIHIVSAIEKQYIRR